MSEMKIKSGDRFEWRGLDGQYSMDGAEIEINSMTATCCINARLLRTDERPELITIGAADFFAAVDARWLVLTNVPREETQ